VEVVARVPVPSTPGRSVVTRRAVVDIVRTATLGSYGVAGFTGDLVSRLLGRVGIVQPGIDVHLAGDEAEASITVDLALDVAYGIPVAEVARQVDSAVRYAIRTALGREVARLTIHVDGLRYQPGDLPTSAPLDPNAVPADDLAASGTDVA
jgi:uncharacterized alkaline shock family protein YloU